VRDHVAKSKLLGGEDANARKDTDQFMAKYVTMNTLALQRWRPSWTASRLKPACGSCR